MGYYTTQTGTVTIATRDERVAVEALKGLNHNHEDKRGGSYSYRKALEEGIDPYEVRWYSWMPSRYHENGDIRTVGDVLEMLGYEVTVRTDGNDAVYTVAYDNKTGQEDVFLNRLADFATVNIEVVGEDGDKWKWENSSPGHALMVRSGHVVYDKGEAVTVALARLDAMWRQVV